MIKIKKRFKTFHHEYIQFLFAITQNIEYSFDVVSCQLIHEVTEIELQILFL